MVNKTSHDTGSVWQRIQQALGTDGVPETARVMGLTRPSVYDWQNGKLPGLDTLLRIAKVGNVSLHWLITGEGSRSIVQGEQEMSAFDRLRRAEREALQRLAQDKGRTVQEQAKELLVEALIARGLVTSDSKAVNLILQTFGQLPSEGRRLLILQLLQELSR